MTRMRAFLACSMAVVALAMGVAGAPAAPASSNAPAQRGVVLLPAAFPGAPAGPITPVCNPSWGSIVIPVCV
jgi:hypothetical protein